MAGHGEAYGGADLVSIDVAPPVRRESFPGAALQSAREAMGESLRDVSRHTRIPERHLEAIERADYRVFHAALYAVGFARTYARHVGLTEPWIAEAVRAHYLAERLPERDAAPGLESRAIQSAVPAILAAVLSICAALILVGWLLRMWG